MSMFVQLFTEAGEPLTGSLRVLDGRVQTGPTRIWVRPQRVYVLRVYAEETDGIQTWRPEPLEDVTVIEITAQPPEQPADVPATAQRQVLQVRFEVFNDRPLRHVIRWGFRADESGAHAMWRLPLVVRPRFRRVRNAVISVVLGIAMAAGVEIFSPALAYGEPLQVSRSLAAWFGIMGVMGLIATVYFIVANNVRWTLPEE